MINPTDFRDRIVLPVLEWLQPVVAHTKPATQLLLGTWVQESGGIWLDQTTPGPGPAYGPYQMEVATFKDNVDWMQKYHKNLYVKYLQVNLTQGLENFTLSGAPSMGGNWYLATFMTRVHYYRRPGSIPDTLTGQAAYWKVHYNTILGAGAETEYISNYRRFIGKVGI